LKLGLSIPQVGVNGTRENALKLAQAAEKEKLLPIILIFIYKKSNIGIFFYVLYSL